jgi:hypothetical protein
MTGLGEIASLLRAKIRAFARGSFAADRAWRDYKLRLHR